jgi:hypothetical protein
MPPRLPTCPALHASTSADASRTPVAEVGTIWTGKWSLILPRCRLPRYIYGSFTCRKSATWDPRLYFPSEGRRADDFSALKNPTASAGFEPANLGIEGLIPSRYNDILELLLSNWRHRKVSLVIMWTIRLNTVTQTAAGPPQRLYYLRTVYTRPFDSTPHILYDFPHHKLVWRHASRRLHLTNETRVSSRH